MLGYNSKLHSKFHQTQCFCCVQRYIMKNTIAFGILGLFVYISVIGATFNPNHELEESCNTWVCRINTLMREKRSPGKPKKDEKPKPRTGELPTQDGDTTTAKPSKATTVKPTGECNFELNTTQGFEISAIKEKPCEDKKCCSGDLEHNRCLPVKDKTECNTQVQGCEYCENSYHKCNTIYFQDTQVCHFEPPQTVCTVNQEDTDCTCNTPCTNLDQACGGPGPEVKPPPPPSPPNVPININMTFDGVGDKIMDIYFLLDFSVSTKADDQRSRMFKYAEFLYQKYKEAGKDLRLGFGSFVDKEVVESRSGKDFREDKNKKGDEKGGASKKRPKRESDGSKGKKLTEAEGSNLKESMGRAAKTTKKPTTKPVPTKPNSRAKDEEEPSNAEKENPIGEATGTDAAAPEGGDNAEADKANGGVLAGHSFRNVFNLTTSYDEVIKKIQDFTKDNQQFGEVGLNRYTRESQLEALSQIGKCHIGWRDTATRIVVMMTDGGFHEADEDAENQNVGGLLEPYDGNCHLDDAGLYGKWNKFKYPKVDQVYKILDESKVTTLVAYFKTNRTELPGYESWKEDYEKDFKQWSDYVKNSKYPAKLFVWTKTDTDGLKKAVDEVHKSGLEAATGASGGSGGFKISLSPTGDQPKDVELKYFSKCDGDTVKETDTCKNMPKNNKLEFTAQLTLKTCDPPPEKKAFNLEFKVDGISYPSVVRYVKLCDLPPGEPGAGGNRSGKDDKKNEGNEKKEKVEKKKDDKKKEVTKKPGKTG